MGRSSKIYISGISSQEECAHAIREADENDLRLLGALLLFADGEGSVSIAGLDELLGIEKSDINASVKYWKGAGIISSAPATRDTQAPEKQTKAIARFVGVEEYTTDELVSVIERGDRAGFVDEAQKAMGKMFNKNEVGKLIGIVDQLGFEEEAVLAILSYCVRLGRKSLSYAEKIAISFHDEELLTAEQVHAEIDSLEKRHNAVEKIKYIFGFGSRPLSAYEKKTFAMWTEEWGFGTEIVKMAYDITVDATHESSPKYANAILKKWHENGLTTPAEIEGFMAEQKQNAVRRPAAVTAKGAYTPKKNEEVEDWFEQRLRQSFGE